ncbi:MAG: AlpA family phage regulatory protein [Burkholderiaceae bacterium]|nr:AlpA family phage regulatory protein [Burkholderiaceae bacterium]
MSKTRPASKAKTAPAAIPPADPRAESILVRAKASPKFVGLPPSTFALLAKTDPRFPPKIVLGPRTVAYRRADLLAWIDARAVRQGAA